MTSLFVVFTHHLFPRKLQKFFVKGGGVIKDYHKVTEIIPGDMVTVKTNKGSFEARKVIITAGPWGPAMVKRLGVDLPFKVQNSRKLPSVCVSP